MTARRPAVVKLAVTPARLTDQLTFPDAAAAAAGTPVVLIAMGTAGLPSRILAGHVGSCWTYAGAAIAPGQVPPELMRSRYRVGQHTADTQVFGVAGRPIGHSWSPTLHNAALQALGIDGVYLPFEAQDIDDLLATRGGARRARPQRHGAVQARCAGARVRRRRSAGAPARRGQHAHADT